MVWDNLGTAVLLDFSDDNLSGSTKLRTAKQWLETKGFELKGVIQPRIDLYEGRQKAIVKSKIYVFSTIVERLSRVEYVILDERSYFMSDMQDFFTDILNYCDVKYDIVHLSEGLEEVCCYHGI